MRTPPLACLAALAAALALAPAAHAQQPQPVRMKIDKVKIGFRTGAGNDVGSTFKPGLWVPVHVTLVAAPDGPLSLPVGADRYVRGEIRVESIDSDGVPNIYPEPFNVLAKEHIDLVAYAKVAASNPELKVSVNNVPFHGTIEGRDGREINTSLYLTLGARLPGVHKALIEIAKARNEGDGNETGSRFLAHETEVHRLPTRWFGYDGIDLVVLTTDNQVFLDELLRNENRRRVTALVEWVLRGGHLIVSVSWRNQGKAHDLLTNRPQVGYQPWQPKLPDMLNPAPGKQPQVPSLGNLHNWASVPQNKPLLKEDNEGVNLAQLKVPPGAEVFVSEGDYPLIVRTPYGRGSITLLAFDVAKAPFATSDGAPHFWKVALSRFAPQVLARGNLDGGGAMRGNWPGQEAFDLTTRLQLELDKFDTPPISFGWVALFIVLYIAVVGPLDYLLLKKVFKKLELTWITFPAVVLTISLIAYFTAYAIKGNDLKINKIDLVDLDLRTDLDKDLRPQQAQAYGRSWFTILSPRIENYTIGIEPVFPRLVDSASKETPPAMVSWLGRPEAGGMSASGRRQSQGLFTRTYQYEPDARGLKEVPIPVWSTKAFTASWQANLQKLPFEVKLEYDRDKQVTGTIKSNLPLDLQDVVLFYRDKWHKLPSCQAKGGQALKINIAPERGNDLGSWSQQEFAPPQVVNFNPKDRLASDPYHPGQVIREMLFYERGGSFAQYSNHAERRLDESWRLWPNWRRGQEPGVVHDAILVGRLARADGPAETLTAENDPRLPTHLWLGTLPGGDAKRQTLSGTLAQDTYIRVFVAVTPKSP